MVRYEAYMLVDLLPPFLKTYGYAIEPLDRGRRLSDEASAARLEIGQLEVLARELNALQVLVFTCRYCCRISVNLLHLLRCRPKACCL